jgi:hypothetical protein
LNRKEIRLLLCLCTFAPFCVHRVHGQARIDPSLPEAPLGHERAFFLFPGYDVVRNPHAPAPPLRTRQKFEMAYRTTLDPGLVERAAFVSGFEEAASMGPRFGPGASGFGELFGYNAANVASMNFFVDGLLPVVFHQDPRYFRKGSGAAKSRVWWALRSEFVTYSDRGKQMPNYSNILGYGMSTALSAAYLPPENVSFGKTMQGIGIKEGVGFGFNLMHEFRLSSLLRRRLRKH